MFALDKMTSAKHKPFHQTLYHKCYATPLWGEIPTAGEVDGCFIAWRASHKKSPDSAEGFCRPKHRLFAQELPIHLRAIVHTASVHHPPVWAFGAVFRGEVLVIVGIAIIAPSPLRFLHWCVFVARPAAHFAELLARRTFRTGLFVGFKVIIFIAGMTIAPAIQNRLIRRAGRHTPSVLIVSVRAFGTVFFVRPDMLLGITGIAPSRFSLQHSCLGAHRHTFAVQHFAVWTFGAFLGVSRNTIRGITGKTATVFGLNFRLALAR